MPSLDYSLEQALFAVSVMLVSFLFKFVFFDLDLEHGHELAQRHVFQRVANYYHTSVAALSPQQQRKSYYVWRSSNWSASTYDRVERFLSAMVSWIAQWIAHEAILVSDMFVCSVHTAAL